MYVSVRVYMHTRVCVSVCVLVVVLVVLVLVLVVGGQGEAAGALPGAVDMAALLQSLQSWGQMGQVTSLILQRLEASPLGRARAPAPAVAAAPAGRRRRAAQAATVAVAEAAAPVETDPLARMDALPAAQQALAHMEALLVRFFPRVQPGTTVLIRTRRLRRRPRRAMHCWRSGRRARSCKRSWQRACRC
jgi:hypothetical protein